MSRPTIKIASLTKRMVAAKHAAGFTLKDLAAWIDGVSWQAVSTWLNGRQPKGYRYERVDKALTFLERELKKTRSALPIPLNVKEGDRRAYVQQVRANYPTA